jgi:hypothetical protein
MEEKFLRQQMLSAYHELAPEAGSAGVFLVERLAKLLYERGARIEIGIDTPIEKRTIHHSLDPDQRLVWVCKQWNQTMGFRSRAAIGRHISDILTPDSFAHFLAELWPTVTQQGHAGPFEVTLVTAHGQPLKAVGKSERMRDPEGIFVRTFAKLSVWVPRSMNDALARAALLFWLVQVHDPISFVGRVF